VFQLGTAKALLGYKLINREKMNNDQFILEIYVPGRTEEAWAIFQSSLPFQSIHAGDLINPYDWPGSNAPLKIARVTSVEHILWQSNGIAKHKLCVYTEELDNTKELRFPMPE
jgi:hypothetical protein